MFLLKLIRSVGNFGRFQIDSEQKKDSTPAASEKKEDDVPEVKKPEVDPPDEAQPNEILTTLEGASFQSRFPYDKMTT